MPGPQALLDTADDAVFLIGADGSLREVSPAAQKLLALATHGRIAPGAGLAVVGESARPALCRPGRAAARRT